MNKKLHPEIIKHFHNTTFTTPIIGVTGGKGGVGNGEELRKTGEKAMNSQNVINACLTGRIGTKVGSMSANPQTGATPRCSTKQLAFLLQQLLEEMAEFFPTQFLINARARLPNGKKIIFITQDTGMERPLPAPPRPTQVYGTTGVLCVKNTVVIHDLHLHHLAGYPPVFFFDFLPGQAQFSDHPFLIILIQRDRGFALAARAATSAGEDIRERGRCFFHDGDRMR